MPIPWASKSNMSYKAPPPTLFVSYGVHQVAELKRVNNKYLFKYLDAFHSLNLSPLPGLPAGVGESVHSELPSFFKERLPDLRRPEISLWLMYHPHVNRNDELQLLAALGHHSITDSFVLTAA
jgi:hypothetical protein